MIRIFVLTVGLMFGCGSSQPENSSAQADSWLKQLLLTSEKDFLANYEVFDKKALEGKAFVLSYDILPREPFGEPYRDEQMRMDFSRDETGGRAMRFNGFFKDQSGGFDGWQPELRKLGIECGPSRRLFPSLPKSPLHVPSINGLPGGWQAVIDTSRWGQRDKRYEYPVYLLGPDWLKHLDMNHSLETSAINLASLSSYPYSNAKAVFDELGKPILMEEDMKAEELDTGVYNASYRVSGSVAKISFSFSLTSFLDGKAAPVQAVTITFVPTIRTAREVFSVLNMPNAKVDSGGSVTATGLKIKPGTTVSLDIPKDSSEITFRFEPAS